MNSYFDQQWDQQLAGHPQALAAFSALTRWCCFCSAATGVVSMHSNTDIAAFSALSPAAQERIVGYVQSCDDTWEASRRIRQMLERLETGESTPPEE